MKNVFSALMILVASSAAVADGEREVTLTPVKYDEYRKQVVPPSTAKYTLVDAWATWCGPCKENFPHVVEMHEKYAKRGLNVVSLSLDDADEPKAVAEALKFLKEKKASFTNFVMRETPDDAFEKLDLKGVPAVFIYGRDGKEVLRFALDDPEKPYTYEEVETAVMALLDGKPVPQKIADKARPRN